MLPTVEEDRGYDFNDPENAEKWRGVLVNALKKVLDNLHPKLPVEHNALQYVESLCLRLLSTLVQPPTPRVLQDVEERVARSFPTPLDRWAVKSAREILYIKKKHLVLPVDKLHSLLQKEVLQYKIDTSVTIFIAAILEYMSGDILRLAGNFVKKISHKSGIECLTMRDVNTAMCADKVLMDMFYQDSDLTSDCTTSSASTATCKANANERNRRGSLTYAELVRELVTDEKHFLRDLNLIIRVFKDELDKILDHDTKTVNLIFGNIMDIYELTVTLLANLEDAIEMAQDSPTPYVGSCFEELAEVEEFQTYVRYAIDVTKKSSRDALQRIVDDPALAERLDTAGHGFRLCVKYYLPKLLLAPVGHVFLYHHYVLALMQLSAAPDDRESFKQVACTLLPITKLLVKELGNGPKMDATLRMATRARRQLAIEKCSELAKLVDNWDQRDIAQCCNEFIREDTISKIGPGKRVAERRAYLFDGLLLLCKPVTSLVSTGGGSGSNPGTQQLKLKEKLHIRKVDLVDRPDTEEMKNIIELCPRVGAPVVLSCNSCAEKRSWMCELVMLNTKPMLDRSLDSILVELEKRVPLRLPPPYMYKFAVPDSPDNIILEPTTRQQPPAIKGATLLKLIERVTYHVYADLALMRTFLTTYRSFCSPRELLGLLQQRFQIPTSHLVAENSESSGTDAEKLSKNVAREDYKRYRKEFEQPVKFRVINVIRHWVDQHFYDFERDPQLLVDLKTFLESVDGKPMRKWVQSVLKTLTRKSQQPTDEGVSHVFDRAPPPVLAHLVPCPARYDWHPLTLHPIELARQLTQLHFRLYRQVKPSELVGAVWTKKDKEKTSPNLLRLIKHTTNFTRWMEKWIVESENLEERAGVVCRLLQACVALSELNNFNGVLAVCAAAGSAAVHRLQHTHVLIPPRLMRALEEYRSLNSDHFRRYQEKLRSINPPCVPFFGMYLTNILHIEEGNLDYLPGTELINFSKRRKVAEIIGEIQQYQNQPYCLQTEPKTMAFLESLDPFPDMIDNEIPDYLYRKSLEIEPRPPVKQLPKFPRKYPELSLKHVKVSRRQVYGHPPSSEDGSSQLSPTSSTSWDGVSLSSLSFSSHDDHRSWKDSGWSLPGLSGSSQLSLLDKGLSLLDLPSRSSKNDEPPSPRERHSPRHERSGSTVSERRGTLSPRGAIVDADLFYCRSVQDRIPLLRPRNSTISTSSLFTSDTEATTPTTTETDLSQTDKSPDVLSLLMSLSTCSDRPPDLPDRPPDVPDRPPDLPDKLQHDKPPEVPERLPDRISDKTPDRVPDRPPDIPDRPPEIPERPAPSPKLHDAYRMSGVSPKRSPALPSPSPRTDRGNLFKFPAPLPPPSLPPPPLVTSSLSPSTARECVPPPLPPRRKHTHYTANSQTLPPCMSSEPPPLPPRLMRVANSTLLQRRHSSNTTLAPRLPPKPPPPAVAPRT